MNAGAIICCAVGLAIIVPMATAATAEQTIIKRKGREPELVDEAAYSRVSREYRVTRGRVTVSVPAAQVEYCKPPKPHGFDRTNDIAGLEAVLKKHHRLWWDVAAFNKLMPLYLKKGAHGKAVRLYRDMQPLLGDSMPLSLRRDYWVALDKGGQSATLQKELTDTVANGTREASAWAYLMRGDILLSKRKGNEALVDGYLKTVILFRDIKSCRKDALEKTAAAMHELRDSRAEKFHKMLREEFPE